MEVEIRGTQEMNRIIKSRVFRVTKESVAIIVEAFVIFTVCAVVIVALGAGLLGLIALL